VGPYSFTRKWFLSCLTPSTKGKKMAAQVGCLGTTESKGSPLVHHSSRDYSITTDTSGHSWVEKGKVAGRYTHKLREHTAPEIVVEALRKLSELMVKVSLCMRTVHTLAEVAVFLKCAYLNKTFNKKEGRAWWCTFVIPVCRRQRLGGSWFNASLDKKISESPILTNKLSVEACICNPSMQEA
jgi:hypothetical protein